jgi:WD40 repeat protein
VLERHQGRIADLDWSPDGATLLSCSMDGTACLWEVASGRLARVWRHVGGPLACCALHPSNPNLLLLGTGTGQLLALNASTGDANGLLGSFALLTTKHGVSLLLPANMPCGRSLIACACLAMV